MNKPKKLKDMIIVIGGGTVFYWSWSLYSGNESFYKNVVMPATRIFGPETAHNLAVKAAKYKLVPRPRVADPPCLNTKIWGREFSTPVGLAAGFDKDGQAVDGLLKMGFSFVEVGSVTPLQQHGNPKPRVFRLQEDKAIINRYGFNSDGHDTVYNRLKFRESEPRIGEILTIPHMQDERNRANVNFWTWTDQMWPNDHRLKKEAVHAPDMAEERNMLNINFWTETPRPNSRIRKVHGCMGVNLGKNKLSAYPVDDYVQGVKKFGKVADYIVLNISSPNTPGLRDMQGQKQLENLLELVVAERNKLRLSKKPALLVKIAPDLSDKDKEDIAAIVTREHSVDGLVISNTTIGRPDMLTSPHKIEVGGLSGSPLRDLSTKTIYEMYKLTGGKLPIIGVGGISNGQDAYDKIKAGACLVQVYTALIYEGPPVIAKIKRELEELLRKDGYASIGDAVGLDHRKS